MKKYISLVLVLAMALTCMTACGRQPVEKSDKNELRIVTTIFPIYSWVKGVLGDNPSNAEVTMLLDKGVDLHSYQPTAEDIRKVAGCDMFLYVGGESDEWVEDVLKEASNKDMVVINLMDIIGDAAKEEEVKEGMQAEEEKEEESGEAEYDEHVWLSLRKASALVNAIEKKLEGLDKANAETYQANADAYSQKLTALDQEYRKAVKNARVKTLLFGDRFPFRYLVDDYGLDYYAAFVGCSAETEASFETITFLARKVDELGLSSVLTIEGKDHSIAETIVRNTQKKNQKVLTMDSMQSTTGKDVEEGAEYIRIMEDNLNVLKKALR